MNGDSETTRETQAEGWSQPKDVDDVLLAFPADVDHLLPKYEDVKADFGLWGRNPWVELVSHWFHSGLTHVPSLRDGIDRGKAFRHLRACMGSFQPKHERKIAGVAYLLSRWSDDDPAKLLAANRSDA